MENKISNDLVVKLARIRKRAEEIKLQRESMLATVTESDEYKGLVQVSDALEVEEHAARAEIKQAAVAYFQATGEKKINKAVSIVEYKTVTLTGNMETRRAWVEKNVPLLLIVDNTRLKKMVRSGDVEIPVEVGELTIVPDIRVKQDLSEWTDG